MAWKSDTSFLGCSSGSTQPKRETSRLGAQAVTAESENSNGGRVRLEELKAAPRCPSTGSGVGLPGLKPEGSSHLLSVETLKNELTCKASIFLPVLQEKQ